VKLGLGGKSGLWHAKCSSDDQRLLVNQLERNRAWSECRVCKAPSHLGIDALRNQIANMSRLVTARSAHWTYRLTTTSFKAALEVELHCGHRGPFRSTTTRLCSSDFSVLRAQHQCYLLGRVGRANVVGRRARCGPGQFPPCGYRLTVIRQAFRWLAARLPMNSRALRLLGQ
jgi:hypothetical protein